MRSRGARLVVLVIVALAVVLARPTRAHLSAASLLVRFSDPAAHGGLADLERHPVNDEIVEVPTPRGLVRARLYTPVGVDSAPGIVLLHGVHRLAIDEPRLVRFARTTAAAGVVVLTPELRELADYRIDPASLDTIGASAHALRDRLGGKRAVGLMGMSFAGGLAIVAAADARFAPDVAYVVAIGAHHDLGRVLRFFATNTVETPNGAVTPLRAHDYGPLVLVYSHVEDFFPEADAGVARDALRLWLSEDFEAARARATALSPDARTRIDALFAHDLSSIAPELLAEIDRHRADLAPVSPSAHLDHLRCPLFLLHGAGDTVIPAAETEWLAHDAPQSLLGGVLVSNAIQHVELHGEPSLSDRWAIVHFMAAVLEAADSQPRAP